MQNHQSRKQIILCLGVLLFALLNACVARNGDADRVVTSNTEHRTLNEEVSEPELSLRDSVQLTFQGELGVSEQGGDNRGDRVEEYLESCGFGPGYAWCACFTTWGFEQHKVHNPQSAWSPDWFPEGNTVYNRSENEKFTGDVSDVIGIYFPTKERIAHVGVIDKVTENYVVTIEGNTNDSGSREGDRVMRKKRFKRQVYKVSRWVKD